MGVTQEGFNMSYEPQIHIDLSKYVTLDMLDTQKKDTLKEFELV